MVKYILSILLLFAGFINAQNITINADGQPSSVTINAPGKPSTITINRVDEPPPSEIDFTKNVQKVENVNFYEAFGHMQRTGEDRITYFYRRGTAHRSAAGIYYRHFTISTREWSPAVLIYEDPEGLDMRDPWGGMMDNGVSVLFSSRDEFDIIEGSLKSHAVMLKGNVDTGWSEPVSLFNGNVPELQRGLCFGGMQYGGSPGNYLIAMWQRNANDSTDDEATVPINRLFVLRTTDYWETWTSQQIYRGTNQHTENSLARFSDGRMTSITRTDNGSFLRSWESTNDGSSWTRYSDTKLGYNTSYEKIPFSYINSNGLLDVFFQCRDNGWLMVSRNNDPDVFMGGGAFNTQELWYYNRYGSSPSNSYRLGYISTLEVEPGKYFMVFARQESLSKANLWWSFDDFTKSAPPPAPPSMSISNLSASLATVTCNMYLTGGYTQDESANIQYFEVDLSLDSDFSTFTTAKPISNSASVVEVNEFRNESHYVSLFGLTSATTYYVRMRAVNSAGHSDWTSTSFTTL